MSWRVRKMVQYVAQSKYLQKIKENDEACLDAFKNAKFLLFFKSKPFLKNTPRLSIAWAEFKGKSYFQCTLLPKIQAFLFKKQCDFMKLQIKLIDAEIACKELKNSSVLLNIEEDTVDTALFACQVDPDKTEGRSNGMFTDVRQALLLLQSRDASLVSRGYSLLKWHDTFKFCPSCASTLTRNISGTFKQCTKPCNPSKIHHYPQTCPVAITRVVDSDNERIVLVRQSRHPRGMYTCVAGFIEPGENLENTVRREIAEEIGLVVDQIQYFGSQTWALPQDSLMLGCCAKAMPGSENLDIDRGELEGAKWFTRDEVRAAFKRITLNPSLMVSNENGDLIIPPSGAIAHDLLKDWVNETSKL